MFQDAIAREGLPDVVHADSGPAMRSTVLKDYLADLGVTQTHNQPRVSNDNPYSESEFRTMKYRPNYTPAPSKRSSKPESSWAGTCPGTTENHKHSGIALFSPNEVHDGTGRETLGAAQPGLSRPITEKHPERFRRPPMAPAPAGLVGINLPADQPPQPRPNDSRQNDTARTTHAPAHAHRCIQT